MKTKSQDRGSNVECMSFYACLSDTNEELIKAFKVVSVGELIKVLDKHQKQYDKNPAEYYYRLSDDDN